MGFLLNEQKTHIQRLGQQQNVTGIVVNEKLRIPADYRRKLRQELYFPVSTKILRPFEQNLQYKD